MTRKELIEQIREKKSFLCVGLDTDLDKMPKGLKEIVKKEYEEEEMTFGMLFEFSTRIIDATAPYCVAYKPNLAFYEAYGLEGMAAFEGIIEYLQENYPKHLIIADAKRGDIGNTSKMYAKTFFEVFLFQLVLSQVSMLSSILLLEVSQNLLEGLSTSVLLESLLCNIVSGLIELLVHLLTQLLVVNLMVILALNVLTQLLRELGLEFAHRLDSLHSSLEGADHILF